MTYCLVAGFIKAPMCNGKHVQFEACVLVTQKASSGKEHLIKNLSFKLRQWRQVALTILRILLEPIMNTARTTERVQMSET